MKPGLLSFIIGVLFFLGENSKGEAGIYSPVGKRDPFLRKNTEDRNLASQESSLFRYQIDQFELKAIRKGPQANQILISDPEGEHYILSEGDQFAKSRVTVSRILEREVILTEQTKNYLGRSILSERILSLPEDDINQINRLNQP